MFDLNSITLIGRLTRDPELKFTSAQKPVCTFSIANNQGKDKVSFFNITAWEKLAETCNQYLKKGSLVCISGSITQHVYTDKEGIKKYDKRVTARTVQFLSNKSNNQQANKPEEKTEDISEPENFETPDDNTDIPF